MVNREETEHTGVVYKVTHKETGKCYIGRAFSYVKNGNQPLRKHGAQDRFYKHWKAAQNGSEECPLFYEALKASQQEDWTVETLTVCSKKHLKERETCAIKKYKSYLPEKGYNVFMGDSKPDDGENKDEYEKKKAKANRDRAKDGALKKSKDGLPPCIYNRVSKLPNGNVCEGYFVQIKVDGSYKSKAFMSKKQNKEEKLEAAKEWLAEVKKEDGLD